MSLSGADSIGRTLARLGHLATRSDQEKEGSRAQIMHLIQESAAPVSLEDISAATNLHVNTIRTHVEVLRAAGRLERVRDKSSGRGRPRWLYVAVVSDDRHQRLAAQLARELDSADDPALSDEAARRWRAAEHVSRQPVESPDEAVTVAAESLAKLGFDVEVSPTGDAVYLGRCPYAALVREHPVICDIHARALEQVLAGTGQDVRLDSLDVFPRPGVCVAHLRRADVAPEWVVPGEQPSEAKKSRRIR